jgi:4-hydroxy-tetrahydrodipicolinate synthase
MANYGLTLSLCLFAQMPMKKGSTCALVTPFLPNGEIDVASLQNLLRFHLDSGTDNLCILGTTGEASVMSMKERALILSTAVEMCKGKIPILAGVGTIDPKHVEEMTQQAIDLGCDASLVVTPYYVKPPQRALIKHMSSMADLGLPVIIYNIPGRTKVDMSDESISICAQHENIVGLKDATGDLSRVQSLRKLVGDDFLMYSGDDGTSPEFVSLGGDGCISVTANLAPKDMHDIMMAVLRGDKQEAEKINEKLKLLHSRLFVESNPIPAKWALKHMGMMKSAYCRPRKF